MNEWVAWAGIPVAGWVISVERRLASLGAIKEKVDDVDEKVDKIVDHLLGAKNGSDTYRSRPEAGRRQER